MRTDPAMQLLKKNAGNRSDWVVGVLGGASS